MPLENPARRCVGVCECWGEDRAGPAVDPAGVILIRSPWRGIHLCLICSLEGHENEDPSLLHVPGEECSSLN